jgi:carboxylesterase
MWHVLADQFYDLGYNVLMARVAHHGLQDRETNDLANLTAEELVRYSDAVVDIAAGLGDHVVVLGLSAGGVMTAWIAEHRSDVYEAVVVSPNFTAPKVTFLATPVDNLLLTLPNQFEWWDGDAKDKVPGPTYAYPRYSTHALAEVYRLGLSVQAASHSKLAAAGLVVITSEADPAVSNGFTEDVVQNWKTAGLTRVVTYQFPASQITFHDILTPEQPYQKTDQVYPKLIELVQR